MSNPDGYYTKINKDIKTKDGKTILKGYGDEDYCWDFKFSEDTKFSSEDDKIEWIEDFVGDILAGDMSNLDGDYSYIYIEMEPGAYIDVIFNGGKTSIEIPHYNEDTSYLQEAMIGKPEPVKRLIRSVISGESYGFSDLYDDVDIVLEFCVGL